MKTRILTILTLMIGLHASAVAQTAYWKLTPTYDDMEVLNPNLIKVKVGKSYGIIDYDGKVKADPNYTEVTPFSNGYSLLLNDDVLKGIVDAKGNVSKIEGLYHVDASAPYFSEGLLAVQNGKKYWGYLKPDGTEYIKCAYTKAFPFSYGLAAVRDNSGYFFHIDSSNRISPLGDGFRDDDLIFASSFTMSKGQPVAVLVNKKYKVLIRSLSGSRLSEAISGVEAINGSERVVKAGAYSFYFNPDWTLRERTEMRSDGLKKIKYEGHDRFEKYLPKVSQLTFRKDDQGKYDLCVNGNVILPAQFESTVPLRSNLCAVSLRGKYGLLKIVDGVGLSVISPEAPITFSHHAPISVAFNVSSQYLMDAKLNAIEVKTPDGTKVTPEFEGNLLTFKYIPTSSADNTYNGDFEVSYTFSDLIYPPQSVQATFTYKPAFEVSWPMSAREGKAISLDSQNVAVFYLDVTNNSDYVSDECTVTVDDVHVDTYSYTSGEKRTIQVKLAIDIQDEDQVTKEVTVVIREKGCPEFKTSHYLVFERYFLN